ncbi:acyltransferase [Sphingomonas carotinifaciens]|nr:acyltransferase [Sphingomonas carotinifaciens]
MSGEGWKRTKFRSVVLRVQGSRFLSDRMRRFLLNFIGAKIHPTATVRHSCWLASADVVMGRNAMLNSFARYDGSARLTIEDNARVASGVTFTTSSHPFGDWKRRSSPLIIVAPITIKEGSWVMADVTINQGVTIAEGCMIGAKALVVEDTEPHGMYLNMASPGGAVRARRYKDLPVGKVDAHVGRVPAPVQLSVVN